MDGQGNSITTMAIAAGTYLGRYEIRSHLGAGGMGEVYLAHDPRLGRTVALKVLTPKLASDPIRMRRFVQEAKTASALNHPNILTIHEISQEGPIHFISTEFIDGVTLREHMTGKRLKLNEILGIGIQVAEALAAAHEAGIAHRDIKPENIMVRRRDQIVKVLDFGLAKLTEQPVEHRLSDPDASTRMMIHTQPSVVVGTIRYMSPEQARGLAVDARTDIWSLGVVLYEMVAGRAPFDGPTASDLIVSILDREPAPLMEHKPAMPAELQRIVKKALGKDREKRYQTVKDLALDLESLRWELEISAERGRSAPMASGAGGAATSRAETTSESTAWSTSQIREAGEVKQQLSSAAYIAAEIKQHRRGVLIGLAAIVLAITSFSYFYFGRTSKPTIDSLAILPFVNVGADPNTEYLSDGITESLTNSISQLPNLAVIAHSSVFRYKGREIDPQAVGRELGVRAVLTGRITQGSDNLLISAELVDVSNSHRIWGEQYDRKLSDILAVQSEISSEISEQLRLRLTGEEQKRVTRHYTENTEAYQAYLKGRYYWNKRTGIDLKKSIEYFGQAVAKDPDYALAYAGLADCYIVIPNYTDIPAQEAYLKAKAAALKALEIDDTLAEAHASLGGVKADYDWDFAGAESELKRAIELNPNYATAHHWYAQYLSGMGRHQEAIREIKRAQELDPLSLIINSVVGDTYIKARQYDQAIEQLRKTIEMDKNFLRAHRYLANAYLEKGMYEEAVTEYQTAAGLAGEDPEKAAKRAMTLREAYAVSGAKGFWEKQLDLLKEDAGYGNSSPYAVAGIYARLGDKDQAFKWLEKAFREHDAYVLYLKTDPQFDALRSDPRAIDLMRRIGLPQ
jgi:serine/threonine protein kinase/tetratricopeptide (TPR) repeat protein